MALEAALNGGKGKIQQGVGPTLRFEVKLDDPTDATTNEVFYPDLLTRKEGKKEPDKSLDPFQENKDDDVLAIAKKMEEKYGSKKKKRRIREEDLIDLGDGYDLNDPFVDDDEVYEDYVPHQVDTWLGGFYINAGSLEYKKVEDVDDTSENPPLMKKSKPSFKKQTSTPKARLASKKVKLAKQQIATSAQRNETMKKKISSLTKSANAKSLFPKKPQETSNGLSSGSFTDSNNTLSVLNNDASQNTSDDMKNKKDLESKPFEAPPPFPLDIPPSVETKIKKIETMVGETDGKLTIKARYAYDSILLEIESECKDMKLKTRTAVFDYLAYVMSITRGSLMNRIKRTIKKKKGAEEGESTLQLLKKAIDESMPEYVNKYDKEMAEYESALKLAVEQEKMDTSKEGEDFQTPAKVFKTLEAGAKLKKPRKIFKWSPKLKSLLCDVVREKVEMELANKERTKSGEDVIMEFLVTTIKPLWPKGWFVKRTLYNITHPVHAELTGYQKKAAVKKEKQTEGEASLDGHPSQPAVLPRPPSPDFAVPLQDGGTTQATLSSILESAPSLKLHIGPKATPTATSSPVTAPLLTSPKNTKSFEGVIKTSTVINTNPVKPALIPSKHFHSSTTSSSTSAVKSSSNATPTRLPIASSTSGGTLIKSSITNSKAATPPIKAATPPIKATTPPIKAATPPILGSSPSSAGVKPQQKTAKSIVTPEPVSTVKPTKTISTAKSGGGGAKGGGAKGGKGGAKGTVSKGPLNSVTQKGPTKVAKITTPVGSDIRLSQEQVDALITSLRNSSGGVSLLPQQQLQLFLQHSPQLYQAKSPSPKPSQTAGGVSVASAKSPTVSTRKATTTVVNINKPSSPTTAVPRPSKSATPIWSPTSSSLLGTPPPSKPKVIRSVSPLSTAVTTAPLKPSIPPPPLVTQGSGSPPLVRKANISGSLMRAKISPAVNHPKSQTVFNFSQSIVNSNSPQTASRSVPQIGSHSSPQTGSHSAAQTSSYSAVHTGSHSAASQNQKLPFYTTSTEHSYAPLITSTSNLVRTPMIQNEYPIGTSAANQVIGFPSSSSTAAVHMVPYSSTSTEKKT